MENEKGGTRRQVVMRASFDNPRGALVKFYRARHDHGVCSDCWLHVTLLVPSSSSITMYTYFARSEGVVSWGGLTRVHVSVNIIAYKNFISNFIDVVDAKLLRA